MLFQYSTTIHIVSALAICLLSTTYSKDGAATSKQASTAKTEAAAAARRAFIRDSLRQERYKMQAATIAKEAALRESYSKDPIQEKMPCVTCPSSNPGVTPASVAELPHQPEESGEARPSPPAELPVPDSIMVKSLKMSHKDVRDVFLELGRKYEVNILLAGNVTGEINVDMANVRLKDALHRIAEQNGFRLFVIRQAIKVTAASR